MKSAKLQIGIEPDLLVKTKRRARELGVTHTEFVTNLLREAVEKPAAKATEITIPGVT